MDSPRFDKVCPVVHDCPGEHDLRLGEGVADVTPHILQRDPEHVGQLGAVRRAHMRLENELQGN